ncbi:MAPEG family protein [Wenzhouxiangella marina]|uniref:Uncharacterized protein n=1 Tax=Wenzhouxiangella marina TaxID=1579979 RepID=A0A0K0XVA6_9GAMM|nr:MAPEG family protein [Wenzhouxiangella marina]AKS41600.1 hypothetical protein WM2015_1226 [Wenzhouxiangella marina]MBB6086641.1 hypothetical protein [Wenzhouxiangella marina]
MAAHLFWAAWLYALLTVLRAPAVWGLGASTAIARTASRYEPRVSANLSNQFEWPLFFHVVCLVLMAQNDGQTGIVIGLAWVFVAGRILHSVVQVLTGNVRLRGLVFMINFLAVLGLWIVALQEAFVATA